MGSRLAPCTERSIEPLVGWSGVAVVYVQSGGVEETQHSLSRRVSRYRDRAAGQREGLAIFFVSVKS